MPKAETQSAFWRYVTNFWTLIFFLVIIKDVMMHGKLDSLIGPVAAIYAVCLAIYSAEKEFERWENYPIGRHPGEIYVAVWTLLIVGLMCGSYFDLFEYEMNPEITATYIVVLGVLAVTKKSKNWFIEKQKRG